MLRRVFALSAIAIVSAATAAQAAPVVATYNPANGNITFSGLTGEVGLTMKGPAANLVPASALSAGSNSVDVGIPGEITYANFGGYQGTLNGGNIITPGLTQNPGLSLAILVDFGGTMATGTIAGFNVIPEPTSFVMSGAALIGLVAARRRRVA